MKDFKDFMKINFIHHRIFFNLTTNTNDNENAGAIVDIFKNSKSFYNQLQSM